MPYHAPPTALLLAALILHLSQHPLASRLSSSSLCHRGQPLAEGPRRGHLSSFHTAPSSNRDGLLEESRVNPQRRLRPTQLAQEPASRVRSFTFAVSYPALQATRCCVWFLPPASSSLASDSFRLSTPLSRPSPGRTTQSLTSFSPPTPISYHLRQALSSLSPRLRLPSEIPSSYLGRLCGLGHVKTRRRRLTVPGASPLGFSSSHSFLRAA
ncbi:hypothetical protein FB45DRAFT_890692 [Roridomyces roridus]|uniref:Uncharacterized protein n=1 Tax=Roridomyces roridus TaxID=1738132 RepID=A0AAD7CDV4_9AGAR|nr:hypothetical protein FB45DRAFT_890692 [Roridomyces roridus]